MAKKDYKCPNKCNFDDGQLKEKLGITWEDIAQKENFKFCPICGMLYPATIKKINQYFDILQLQKSLNCAKDLILLTQFEAAIREAIIVLENKIQDLSGLQNLNGAKLVSEALKFDYEKMNLNIIKKPIIQINNLSNITEINEHEGLMLMLLGFFKGARNILMHKSLNSEIYLILNVFTQISFFISILNGDNFSNKIIVK